MKYLNARFMLNAGESLSKVVGRPCPWCGAELLLVSRCTGALLRCKLHPRCRYVLDPQKPSKARLCPKCGRRLLKRRSPFGVFWGCSRYPRCSHGEPLDVAEARRAL